MSNHHDAAGIPYSHFGTGPAPSQTQVTIHSSNGPVPGTMVGGYVVPNK